MKWSRRKAPSVSNKSLFYLIPLAIPVTKLLDVVFRIFDVQFTSPPQGGNWFVSNFIEWFGVLYGILLPLILVRVWEQLDSIDREFDREADTVRILYNDLSYLEGKSAKIGNNIAILLRGYVQHIVENYTKEIKNQNDGMENLGDERKVGDEILQTIREQFGDLIHPNIMKTKVWEFLIPELFDRLNEIIDIRGDRIARASQRLFESLRLVALITSIMFIIPFYFAAFTSPTGVLDVILIIGVTLLVIFIYVIIEDLDEPFKGTWKITDESWRRVLEEMNLDERNKRKLENSSTEKALPKPKSRRGGLAKRRTVAKKA